MRDVRGRTLWIVIAGCAVAGSLVLASGSGGEDGKDDDVIKKKDVRVIVSGNAEPNVWVSSDDDDDDDAKSGAYLGVSTEEDTKIAEGGARVDSVADDSPADKAGLHRGDTIVSFDGTAIHGPARLSEKIHSAKPGDRVELKVHRKEGKTETLSVEMGERPKIHGYWYGTGSDATPIPNLEHLDKLGDLGHQMRILKAPLGRWYVGGSRPRLGIEMVETTPELREFLGGTKESGVLIGKVLPNTPAQRAGLKVGDLITAVDGKRIEGSGELIEAMDDKEGKSIEIELLRDHKTTRVQVAIPKQEEEEDTPTGPRAERIHAFQDELRAHLAGLAIQDHASPAEREAVERSMRDAREAMARARRELGAARRSRLML